MKTCLYDLANKKENGDKDTFLLLQIKKDLLEKRRKGDIFITRNISSIKDTEQFEIYHCSKPSETSEVNAFPVPKIQYATSSSKSDKYKMMTIFYESYYGVPMSYNEYLSYLQNKPVISEDYVWFFKKTSHISDLTG